MDIREEIRLSKEDKLLESSGLPHSGQQSVKGRRGLVSPKKVKSDSPKKRQRSSSPRKGQCERKLAAVVKDPLRYSRSVKGKPAGVMNQLSLSKSNVLVAKADVVKSSFDKEALVDKASVLSVTKTNVLTQLETAPDVVNDKVSKESVLSTGNVDVVQDDSAKVVIQSVLTQLENVPDVENYAPDVGKNDPAKVVKESVAKDKPKGSASFLVVNKDNREGVNDKVLGVVTKDKPKGSVSSVVVRKDNRKESFEKESLFQKEKKLNVVSKDKPKSKALSELPNKADIVKGKHKVHSEVPVLRSKPKTEVKAKASKLVKRKRKGGPDSNSNSADEEEHRKKKPYRKQKKLKAGLKRKKSGSDALESSSIDSEVVKQLISQLTKKVKREECDEESMPKKGMKKLTKNVKKKESDNESKKGKNKEKQLTAEEAAYQEYLSKFLDFHARTTPVSLFSAIRNLNVEIMRFLKDIGFSSLNNVAIDKLPTKLGPFVVSRFKNYKLSFDTGDQIEMWAAQFSPKELKQIRVNDIARILVGSKEIDFLFKVNFLTLFTNRMCKADGLKGEICLDVVKGLWEDIVIS
ncbi:hypothetical protein Tco_0011498 [Tanacetum coccineum]